MAAPARSIGFEEIVGGISTKEGSREGGAFPPSVSLPLYARPTTYWMETTLPTNIPPLAPPFPITPFTTLTTHPTTP